MGDLTKIEDVSAFAELFALLSADAVVATRPWKRRNERKLGSFALTRCTLGPGSWMLTGQCSYSVSGASESEFEIKLDLKVFGKDKQNPRYYRFSYLHFEGNDFGTATVIGAVTVDEIVSVELTYATQVSYTPPNAYPPGCSPQHPILTAIRVPSLFVLS